MDFSLAVNYLTDYWVMDGNKIENDQSAFIGRELFGNRLGNCKVKARVSPFGAAEEVGW